MSFPLRLAMVLAVTVMLSTTSLTIARQAPAKPAVKADDDEAEATGQRVFVENCLICHGEEMATNQRLTTKQWTATVEKMVGWGAPVPPDKKAPLLTYLSGNFSDNATAPKPDVASAKELLASKAPIKLLKADLNLGGTLFTKHCATCHGPQAQGGDLGTNLVEKSILADDERYHEAVRKGVRRMPGFSNVLDATAETNLLAWLRSRKMP